MKFIAIMAIVTLTLIPMAIHAQGHSGHTATPAIEKPKASVPQARAPSQEEKEQVVQDTPQVEIAPELQQRIGVKTVKAAVKPIQKTIRTVGRIEIDEGVAQVKEDGVVAAGSQLQGHGAQGLLLRGI